MTKQQYNFIVQQEDASERLDVWLTALMEDYTRSFIQKMIKEENVLVNKQVKNASYKIKLGDIVDVLIITQNQTDAQPEDIPLDIVYEDDYLIVLNKKRGMVVHPGAGNYSGTLVNALLHHTSKLSDISGGNRPGIVHRLDKDTSGIMVVAKDNKVHAALSRQFQEHKVKREYQAIVKGRPSSESGRIEAGIARDMNNRLRMTVDSERGKYAATTFEVLSILSNAALIKAELETGRTHQIRVHMSFIGNPVLGDDLYGGRNKSYKKGQLLYSKSIAFTHPITKEYLHFSVQPDDYFKKAIEDLSV